MWVREQADMPEKIRVVLLIDTKKHPVLSGFIRAIPFRQTTSVLIAVMEAGLAAASGKKKREQSDNKLAPATSQALPAKDMVMAHPPPKQLSSAASGFVSQFDVD